MSHRSVYHNIPASWDAACSLFEKGNKGAKLGYETYAEDYREGETGAIALYHHNTAIVWYFPDESVEVTTGGWLSATTKARINAALRYSDWGISSERGTWYWYRRGYVGPFVEYEEGDRVYLHPETPETDGVF